LVGVGLVAGAASAATVSDGGAPGDVSAGDTVHNGTTNGVVVVDSITQTDLKVYVNITTLEEDANVDFSSVDVTATATNGSVDASSTQVNQNGGVDVAEITISGVGTAGSPNSTNVSYNITNLDTSSASTQTGLTYDLNVSEGASSDPNFNASSGNAPDSDDVQSAAFNVDGTTNFQVSNLDVNGLGAEAGVELNDTIDATATVTNTGGDAGTQNVTYFLSNSSGVQYQENESVSLNPGENTTVDYVQDTAFNKNLSTGTYAQNVSSDNDTAAGNLSVFDADDRNLVDGELTDDSLNPIDNAGDINITIRYLGGSGDRNTSVAVVNDTNVSNLDNPSADPRIRDDLIGNSGFQDNGQGNIDKYFANVPNFGPGSVYEIRGDLEGFKSFDGTTEALSPGEQDTQSIRLERLVLADQIIVDQGGKTSALADNVDQIPFEVTVLGDQNGDPLASTDVRVTHDGLNDSIFFDGTVVDNDESRTFTTDSNGTFRFNVTANETQALTFTFEDVEDNNAPDAFADKSFILQGEGTVIGDVWDEDSPNRALEDVDVWAVDRNTFFENAIEVPVPANNSESFFYRVREVNASDYSDTIRMLDVTQDYRIDNNGSNDELAISRVRELNTTNEGVGSGWAVRTRDAANATNMFVTPIEPTDNEGNLTEQTRYLLERSDTAPNASDQRFGNESDPEEDFDRVDQDDGGPDNEQNVAGPGPAVDSGDLPDSNTNPRAAFGNSTLEQAQELSDLSGQQLWDDTDAQGEYVLDDMYTDFQAGIEYVLVANKPGYEIEFVDALVTEQGAFFEDGEDENFDMQRVQVTPGFVNITNFGLHPPLSDTGGSPDFSQIDEYSNKTDEFNQTVPRDASVDVISVETRSDEGGVLLNATVDLEVPDDGSASSKDINFTGQIVGVFGGDLVSQDATGPGTFHTGDNFSQAGFDLGEGEAIVLLETDESSQDLRRTGTASTGSNLPPADETGVFAQLTNDFTATDFTAKDFVGVIQFETASISGIVTDSNDVPLPGSPAWAGAFSIESGFNPDRIRIQPETTATPGTQAFADAVDDASDTFVVSRQTFNTTSGQYEDITGEREVVTASTLQSYSFSGIPSLSTNTSFKLFQFASQPDATYSLEPVPVFRGATTFNPANYRIRSVRVSGSQQNIGALSNDALVDVIANTTGTGNVVIPITVDTSGDYALSNLADVTVTEGDAPVDVSVDVTNNAGLEGDQDLTFSVANSSGTVYTDTVTGVQVGAGQTQTVTFTNVPAGSLDNGSYTHQVSSDDDSITANLTVQSSGGSSGVDQYRDNPNNPNSAVSLSGLQDAIDDFIQNNTSLSLLQDVIDEFIAT